MTTCVELVCSFFDHLLSFDFLSDGKDGHDQEGRCASGPPISSGLTSVVPT